MGSRARSRARDEARDEEMRSDEEMGIMKKKSELAFSHSFHLSIIIINNQKGPNSRLLFSQF